MKPPQTPIRWTDDGLRLIDQRLLPGTFVELEPRTVEEVAEAIETLAVRGAPAIGIAAAFGVVVGVDEHDRGTARERAVAAIERLRTTRPTAVNLFFALDRMREILESHPDDATLRDVLLVGAQKILADDLATGERIAQFGFELFPDRESVQVLTHCNAGGLATSGWGTALAPIYAAHAKGKHVRVLADETRPLWQGSRLTAWELAQAGIDVRVLVDGAASSVLGRGDVDLVIVGADRIAANGDTANKIGTYGVALAAREAGVPFYVAAPLSTFDARTPTGADIPVEERAASEVLGPHGIPRVGALNPAFDVTPAALVRGWITEAGVIQPPFDAERLRALAEGVVS